MNTIDMSIFNTNQSLSDTVSLMTSSDYKNRFIAEYLQLKIRISKLENLLKNWDSLSFTPKCSYNILYEQLVYMHNYFQVLTRRAKIENIDLP